jgi:glycosidase
MPPSGAPWYADAVIYGVDVEKFADADGIGDFVGLTERIPYLRDLGITCVWLLPFFPSPNRDLSQPGRNSVRVPMQWSAARNSGFSPAPSDKLAQKPVTQGPFGYKRLDVEAQQKDEGSLLNRFRRLVAVRRSTSAFATGRFVRIDSGHPAVFLPAPHDLITAPSASRVPAALRGRRRSPRGPPRSPRCRRAAQPSPR